MFIYLKPEPTNTFPEIINISNGRKDTYSVPNVSKHDCWLSFVHVLIFSIFGRSSFSYLATFAC